MIYQSHAGSIHYRVEGPPDAAAVAFTHGAGLDSHMFDAQVAALRDRYRILVWDMPGHGNSARLQGPLPFEEMAAHLIGILDEIGAEKAVLVGQSLGSWVSQCAAIRYPDRVDGIVSIGGTPLRDGMGRWELLMYRVSLAISHLLPAGAMYRWTASKKATTVEARRYAEAAMAAIGKQQFLRIVAGMLNAGTLGVEAVPHQPLLIVHGEMEWPDSVAQRCHAWHAATPGSTYAVIPGAGHNANQDSPATFNRVLLQFLSSLDPGQAAHGAPDAPGRPDRPQVGAPKLS